MGALYVILLSLLGLAVHIIGIFVLKASKRRNNQVMMLVNLSVMEILMFIINIIDSGMGMSKYRDKYYLNATNIRELRLMTFPYIYDKVLLLLMAFAIRALCLSMILLNVDRLVCILSPLRCYITFKEKSILKKMMIGSWFLSAVSSLLALSTKTVIISICLGYSLLTILFVLFIVTYVLIGWKIRMSRRLLHTSNETSDSNSSPKHQQIKFQKHHLVPALIIVTFVICYLIPFQFQIFYIIHVKFTKNIHLFIEGLWLLPPAGFISEALIYIFLAKDNRDIILNRLLAMKRQHVNQQEVTDMNKREAEETHQLTIAEHS